MRSNQNLLIMTGLCLALLLCPLSKSTAQDYIYKQGKVPSSLPAIAGTGGGTLSRESWDDERRDKILGLFEEHVYGRVPDMDVAMHTRLKYLDRAALDGNAVMKEVEVELSHEGDTVKFGLLVFLPAGMDQPVPLFLGLNFNGNHTIHPDPSISLTETYLRNSEELHITGNRAADVSRGVSSSRWPVEMILERGYGVATIYCGDLDVDMDDDFEGGVHKLDHSPRDSSSWGTIAAWAWGLSRAMDYLEKDPGVDHKRVAVIGHSRLGKTALWAGAMDERFAMVVSNNSGCGGAALNRRGVGETVEVINRNFPHWFADRFNDYNNREEDLPVDQHMLLALVAPRPLYVASASGDEWADPRGEYMSLYYGSSVWALYGEDSLDKFMPPALDEPRWQGKLGYHIRTGGHGITSWDWEQYLDFADREMSGVEVKDPADKVTMEWIAETLREESPRLILTPETETLIREKLDGGDRMARKGMKLLEQSADALLDMPPLEFKMEGRRLLGVSREAVRRLTTLSLVYRIEQKDEHLRRLEEELQAVCSFETWNPSHFLDVGEMATGVALALDWAGEWIRPEVQDQAREALLELAIKPGLASSPTTFFKGERHNWNLVCNGGMVLAGLCIFEDEPELASRAIHQAVSTIPLALTPYAPDGIYPEGVSYWSYATSYLALTLSTFESALGTDFGFSQYPGVMESVEFTRLLAGPSGDYYNFFDSGSGGYMGLGHLGLQAWFARRSGEAYWQKPYKKLLDAEVSDQRQSTRTRSYPFLFLELVQVENESTESLPLPTQWAGGGDEPIGVFRDPGDDPNALFLAAKGGRAADNHGNMDAGSFILELDGVRWSVDPGNQSYYELELLMGLELWNNGQESPRWSLLTKNNFGHSTITVNGRMFRVEERAVLHSCDFRGENPSFSFDMGPVFDRDVKELYRRFERTGSREIRITDHVVPSEYTRQLTWQMVTTAEVTEENGCMRLEKDGKVLYLYCDSQVPYEFAVVTLDPPPLTYDKQIRDFKRVEIRLNEIPSVPFDLHVSINTETP